MHASAAVRLAKRAATGSRPGVQDDPRLGVDNDSIFGPIHDDVFSRSSSLMNRNRRCRHHGKSCS
jgi:hypothetical protein